MMAVGDGELRVLALPRETRVAGFSAADTGGGALNRLPRSGRRIWPPLLLVDMPMGMVTTGQGRRRGSKQPARKRAPKIPAGGNQQRGRERDFETSRTQVAAG